MGVQALRCFPHGPALDELHMCAGHNIFVRARYSQFFLDSVRWAENVLYISILMITSIDALHTNALDTIACCIAATQANMTRARRMRLCSIDPAPQTHHLQWCSLSCGHPGHRLSTSATPRRGGSRRCCSSRGADHRASRRRSLNRVLPRVLKVQLPFPVDHPPSCWLFFSL